MIKILSKNCDVSLKGTKKYLPQIEGEKIVKAQAGDEIVIDDDFLPYYSELGLIDLDLSDKMKIANNGESSALIYISTDDLKKVINEQIQILEKKYDTELKRLKAQIDNTYKQFTHNLSTPNSELKTEVAEEVLLSIE